MTKYIIGAVLGAVLMFAGTTFASGPIQGFDELYTLYLAKTPQNQPTGTYNVLRKVADHASGDRCYIYGTQGISCVH